MAESNVDSMFTSNDKGSRSDEVDACEPIGPLVRRVRAQRGLSQYALAETLVALSCNRGLSRAEVARWERGKRVPGPYWRAWLSAALDLPAVELGAAARSARSHR